MAEHISDEVRSGAPALQEPAARAGDQQRQPSANHDFIGQVEQPQRGIFAEYYDFLRFNKRWWLTPIIIALLLIGAFVLLSATAAAPFIYTLF